MEAVEDFARRGLRTLVFAHKTLSEEDYRDGGTTDLEQKTQLIYVQGDSGGRSYSWVGLTHNLDFLPSLLGSR